MMWSVAPVSAFALLMVMSSCNSMLKSPGCAIKPKIPKKGVRFFGGRLSVNFHKRLRQQEPLKKILWNWRIATC
jgi:hypothetical protein